jgi:hypothetical protein
MAALAAHANSLHAVDMTELKAWLVNGRLTPVLQLNKEQAKKNPPGEVRRIFIIESRNSLKEPADLQTQGGKQVRKTNGSLLAEVLQAHIAAGIKCGLAYQDLLRERNPDLIRDFAVYGRKVVWFEEGVTGAKVPARGRFSSNNADVEKHLGLFEKLWREHFPDDNGGTPRSTADEAIAFLAAQASEPVGT